MITEHLSDFKKVLDSAANVALEFDTSGEIQSQIYNEEDMLNACVIFNHVIANIGVTKIIRDNLSREDGEKKSMERGANLRKMVRDYTGIDTAEAVNRVYPDKE